MDVCFQRTLRHACETLQRYGFQFPRWRFRRLIHHGRIRWWFHLHHRWLCRRFLHWSQIKDDSRCPALTRPTFCIRRKARTPEVRISSGILRFWRRRYSSNASNRAQRISYIERWQRNRRSNQSEIHLPIPKESRSSQISRRRPIHPSVQNRKKSFMDSQ